MSESLKYGWIRILSGAMAASMLILSAGLTACRGGSDSTGGSDRDASAAPGTISKVDVTMEDNPALQITELMVVNTVGITD